MQAVNFPGVRRRSVLALGLQTMEMPSFAALASLSSIQGIGQAACRTATLRMSVGQTQRQSPSHLPGPEKSLWAAVRACVWSRGSRPCGRSVARKAQGRWAVQVLSLYLSSCVCSLPQGTSRSLKVRTRKKTVSSDMNS